MKYSEFIYKAAIAASKYHDSSATYESFMLGELASQEDFSGYIDGAYHEANAFLQRASSLGKIPTRVAAFGPIGVDMAAELAMGDDFLKPVAVFQYHDDSLMRDYDTLAFKKFGNKVYVVGRYSPYRKIYVQYRVKIPILDKTDIPFITEVTGGYEVKGTVYTTLASALEASMANDVSLDLYNISDELLYIGIDWIKGRLNDEISKGHSEEMEAESRLNDFDADEYLFVQKRGGRL